MAIEVVSSKCVLIVGALLCVLFTPVARSEPIVALVGDSYRLKVMRDLAVGEGSEIRIRNKIEALKSKSTGVTLRTPMPAAGVTRVADMLQDADIALIVVDATIGPTDIIRQHILIARQARVPMLALLFGNVARLHAGAPKESAELLAIEAEEIRALLSAYDLDDATFRVYYDAEAPGVAAQDAAPGGREALRALSNFATRRIRPSAMGQVSEIWAAVYLLTDSETAGKAITLAPGDTIVLWSEGVQSTAKLSSVSTYQPGEFREMSLTLVAPIEAAEGSRLLLVRGDNVVGLGAITQIIH
jgi:translation elongation factor EF-Tu-like GTPase